MSDINEQFQEHVPGKIPKYSVVLRFWQNAQEIEIEDYISCHNTESNFYFYKFIDSSGRLWENVPVSDAIIIKNLPDKTDLEKFMEIKRQMKEFENQPIPNKKIDDVSIC